MPKHRFDEANNPPQRKSKHSQSRAHQRPSELPSRMSEKPLRTIPDAAVRLKCSERKVWRYIRDLELPVVRFGRSTRITEEDLQAFIDRHRS